MTSRLLRNNSGRYRAIWRLAAFMLAWLGASYFSVVVATPLLTSLGGLFGFRVIVYPWTTLLSIALATYFALRRVDGQGWAEIGVDRSSLSAPTLLSAGAVGALAILLPSVALILSGQLMVVDAPPGSWWLAAIAICFRLLPLAAAEEILVHGYLFAVLRQEWGTGVALVCTSLLFGALHILNPGATVTSVLSVTCAGFFLGGIFVLTRSLAAAIVAHLTWNWAIVAVLHAKVSGLSFSTGGYLTTDAGADLLTGGQWGPEGGLPAIVGMLVGYLAMARLVSRSPWPPNWPQPEAKA